MNRRRNRGRRESNVDYSSELYQGCLRKKAYPNSEMANEALERHSETVLRFSEPVPYPCYFGDHWHLGHPPQNRQEEGR